MALFHSRTVRLKHVFERGIVCLHDVIAQGSKVLCAHNHWPIGHAARKIWPFQKRLDFGGRGPPELGAGAPDLYNHDGSASIIQQVSRRHRSHE